MLSQTQLEYLLTDCGKLLFVYKHDLIDTRHGSEFLSFGVLRIHTFEKVGAVQILHICSLVQVQLLLLDGHFVSTLLRLLLVVLNLLNGNLVLLTGSGFRSLVDESVVKVLQGRQVSYHIRPVIVRLTHRVAAQVDRLELLKATQLLRKMDAEEFRQAGREMVDYIADYIETVHERPVLSNVLPGYMKDLLPTEAPETPESWEKIMPDIDRAIMPGVTHWNHPQFHAYYPSGGSFPSVLGDMLSSGIAGVAFSWFSNPAVTELEVIMMDWLAKLIKLPDHFLSGGQGGGIIQSSASESTLVGVLAARSKAMMKLKMEFPDVPESDLQGRLIAYASDQTHTAMNRAVMVACTKYKSIESDGDDRMRGDALRKVMLKDKAAGLVPYFVQVTLGTTAQCAFDALNEIGPICEKHSLWLHVDAAFAGAAFICPEYRHHLAGIEYADSFNFNCHKWMRINFDCAPMWFRDSSWMVETFNVDPTFLKHSHQNGIMPDYRHWQIPLGRRFRALKIWFVLRSFGAEGLRSQMRKQTELAHQLGDIIQTDSRFELTHDVSMTLICFRIRDHDNIVTEKLLERLTDDRRVFVIGAESKGVYFIRLSVNGSEMTEESLLKSWKVVQELTTEVLNCTKSSTASQSG